METKPMTTPARFALSPRAPLAPTIARALALGALLLQSTPALCAAKPKVRVVPSPSVPTSASPSRRSTPSRAPASPDSSTELSYSYASPSTTAGASASPSTSSTLRPKRYITDGNPAPGRFLISPMVGNYALSGFEYGVKASGRILDRGFVPALNNSVSLEGEVFKGTWHGFWGKSESLYVAALGRWDFHLHPSWTVYGAAGILHERMQTVADIPVDDTETELDVQVGGMFVITDNVRLRAEWDESRASFRFGGVVAL
jgi:hypothetical protein